METGKLKRTLFGRIIKYLLLAFNIFYFIFIVFITLLVIIKSSVIQKIIESIYSLGTIVRVSLEVPVVIVLVVFSWFFGNFILGLLAFLTRPKKDKSLKVTDSSEVDIYVEKSQTSIKYIPKSNNNKKIKLFLKVFTLISFILFFVSWHIKIIFTYILFRVLRKRIPFYSENKKRINRGVLILFFVSFWFFFPNRTSDSRNYLQSIYFDIKTGDKIKQPIIPYLSSFIGEGDVMAVVSLASYFVPEKYFKGSAVGDIINYNKSTYFINNNFHSFYRELEPKKTPPHNVPFQIMQDMEHYKGIGHYYLHVPNTDKLQDCEVIVFCHGYAGNWLLYPALFAKYTNAIVIAVETPSFSGYFTKKTMNDIMNKILPHAYDQAGISYKKAHLVGLSNGGSAINTSIVNFPNKFKSFTILSASLKNTPRTNKKVHVIYGSNDRSGGIYKNIPKSKYVRHRIEGEDHGLLVAHPDIIFELINKIIE